MRGKKNVWPFLYRPAGRDGFVSLRKPIGVAELLAGVFALLLGGASLAAADTPPGFLEIPLDGVYTERHDSFDDASRGFFEYYDESPVIRNNVPFWVKTSGINTVSTVCPGPDDIVISVGDKRMSKVHILGRSLFR